MVGEVAQQKRSSRGLYSEKTMVCSAVENIFGVEYF